MFIVSLIEEFKEDLIKYYDLQTTNIDIQFINNEYVILEQANNTKLINLTYFEFLKLISELTTTKYNKAIYKYILEFIKNVCLY